MTFSKHLMTALAGVTLSLGACSPSSSGGTSGHSAGSMAHDASMVVGDWTVESYDTQIGVYSVSMTDLSASYSDSGLVTSQGTMKITGPSGSSDNTAFKISSFSQWDLRDNTIIERRQRMDVEAVDDMPASTDMLSDLRSAMRDQRLIRSEIVSLDGQEMVLRVNGRLITYQR